MTVPPEAREVSPLPATEPAEHILLAMRPPTEAREHARRTLTRVNLTLILVMVFFALLFGWGDLQATLRFLSEYTTNLMLGAAYLGLLQLLSRKLIGSPDFWYTFHESRICYHRPPRFEGIPFEEIREIRRIPMAAGPGIEAEDALCLYLQLKNGREVRLFGMVNLRQAWEFLAARLPELIVEQSRASNQVPAELLPLSRLGWWFFLGACWFLVVYLTVPEKMAGTVMLLGLATAPVRYLLRYHQLGCPASEDHFVFASASASLFCLFGAVVIYFWG